MAIPFDYPCGGALLQVGSHFVQQALLRWFQDPARPGFVWTYVRGQEPHLANIAKVAQSPGFYDPEVETALNQHVEAPTTPLLDVLRRGEDLNAEGRYRVAVYVATTIKRVPRSRQRGKPLIPKVLEDVVEGLRAELPDLAAGDTARLEKYRIDLDAAHEKYRAAAPPDVLDQLRDPRPTREMVEAIRSMSWRLLVATPPEMFLTSDNPVFYFEGRGLGNADSEFSLPLSPMHSLHGCRQPVPGGGLEVRPAERKLVYELNRRMANNATKLLFANKKLKFPSTLLRKGDRHFLSLINWGY